MKLKYHICPCCSTRYRPLNPGEKRFLLALAAGPLKFKDALASPALSAYSIMESDLKDLIAEGYLVKDDDLYAQSEAYRKGAMDRYFVIDLPHATLREDLADLEHRQWAHWTRYMLANLTPENIERWKRQTETPYNELTEAEKDKDREWADEVLHLQVGFKIRTRERLHKERRVRKKKADEKADRERIMALMDKERIGEGPPC